VLGTKEMSWILGADQGDWVVVATLRLVIAPLSVRMKLGEHPESQLRSSQMRLNLVKPRPVRPPHFAELASTI